MNWRTTWLLVGVAAALFGFIFLFERHLPTSGPDTTTPALLAQFKAASARTLQLRHGTRFVIALERTNGSWHYLRPFEYPAATLKVDGFLRALEDVLPSAYITPQEIVARKQTRADFGFDAPAIALSLESANGPHALRFGARTPAGDQIYLEVDGKPGIYVVSTAILDRLPRTQNDWRDTALFASPADQFDRVEVTRAGSGGFALQRDTTNKLWRLTRPAHRADQLMVAALLNELAEARIAAFVSDDVRVDLESFGLHAPEAELTVAIGNNVQRILIGRSPTNESALVFARQVNDTNVVLVSTNVLAIIRKDFTDLRDRRLVSFAPETITSIDVRGEETFTITRQPSGQWTVAEVPVDSAWIEERLAGLTQMQVDFVKDVATDLAPFALDPPRRQITLRAAVTNGALVTNTIVTRLDFGTNRDPESVYVRRADEASVYTIPAFHYQRLPSAVWQLRDHRVWAFTTNQVARVVVREDGNTRQWIRQPNGNWAVTTGEVLPYAMEEIMFRLGELTTPVWLARGEAARQQYGFKATNYQLTIDLADNGKIRTVTMDFGGQNQLRVPYASVVIDGQPWIFEFPWQLIPEMQRHLSIPPPSANL
jgi:hypothetical protein